MSRSGAPRTIESEHLCYQLRARKRPQSGDSSARLGEMMRLRVCPGSGTLRALSPLGASILPAQCQGHRRLPLPRSCCWECSPRRLPCSCLSSSLSTTFHASACPLLACDPACLSHRGSMRAYIQRTVSLAIAATRVMPTPSFSQLFCSLDSLGSASVPLGRSAPENKGSPLLASANIWTCVRPATGSHALPSLASRAVIGKVVDRPRLRACAFGNNRGIFHAYPHCEVWESRKSCDDILPSWPDANGVAEPERRFREVLRGSRSRQRGRGSFQVALAGKPSPSLR